MKKYSAEQINEKLSRIFTEDDEDVEITSDEIKPDETDVDIDVDDWNAGWNDAEKII